MTPGRLGALLARRASRDRLLRDVRASAADCGSHVWLVGGCVRDAARGATGRDLDLVAAGRVRALVAGLELRWNARAFRFSKRGVTTWRYHVAGRSVDLVDATRRGLARDLGRRELTINAIAFDLLRGRIEDPFHGLDDLRARRLRLPRRGVLAEDPLRGLRVARFLAALPDLRLDAAVAAEARAVGRALRRASTERVRDELTKLLLAPAPSRGLRALHDLELADAVLPELTPLRACVAGGDRPDVWTHTVATIEVSERAARRRLPGRDVLGRPADRAVLRWALLLHDVAKPDTFALRDDGRPTFHGHEALGARRADGVLRRLRLARAERKRVARLILLHLRPAQLAEGGASERALARLARDAGDDLPLLVLHAACDAHGSGAPDARVRWPPLRRVLERLLALHREQTLAPRVRLLDGRDVMRVLGLEAGPPVGRALARIAELQDAGRLRTRAQALEWLASAGADAAAE